MPSKGQLLSPSWPTTCDATESAEQRAALITEAGRRAAIAELPYLRPAVALILGFVGVKMLAEYFHVHIPTATSLAIICATLGGGVALLQLGGGGGGGGAAGPRWRAGLGSCLLFCQGVGIATYCLLQKQLVRGDDGAASDDDDEGETGGDALLGARAAAREPWGPVTLTAHACVGSCVVMACAAVVDGAAGLEEPAPLSAGAAARVARPTSLAALAYAAVLSSVVGYSLRAWANRHVCLLYTSPSPRD